MSLRVYVAGPLTKGDQFANVAAAIAAGERVMERGHVPFVPHLAALWHMQHHHAWEHWIRWCLSWVECCDALVRLPGESRGADREVAHAELMGVRVVRSVEALDEITIRRRNMAEMLAQIAEQGQHHARLLVRIRELERRVASFRAEDPS